MPAAALVSDVEFYEDYPSRYNVDVGRRHRWIRGDWQIMRWLLPWVPGAEEQRIANPLSAFVAVENLRQSAAQPRPGGAAASSCSATLAVGASELGGLGRAAGPRDHHASRDCCRRWSN